MQVARILALILFIAVALGDFSGSVTTTANTATTLSLTGGAVTDTALATALGGSVSGGLSVSVTTSAATTLTVTISLSASAYGSVNVAGGANNAATVSLLSALSANGAISVRITSTNNAQVTLTVTTPNIALAGSATVQANLLAGFNDVSASGSVYGAVAYNVNAGGTTTYTIPAGFNPQLFLVALDTSLATSASSSASSSSSSNSNTPGSANFNYNGKFIPVAYNTNYALVTGLQYTYGSNIYVTPIGTNGTAAGSLNISYVGTLGSSSASSGPNNAAAYFSGYYQITGSGNTNNVLQWTSDSSNTGTVFVQGNAQVTSQAFASAYANSATWFKSNTNAGATAAANSWAAVSSQRQVSASGKVSVYANVNSYSQWTVGASGDAASVKAGLFIVLVAILALVF